MSPPDEHVAAFNIRAQPQLNRERQGLANGNYGHGMSGRGAGLNLSSSAVLAISSNSAKQATLNRNQPQKTGSLGTAAPSTPRVLHVSLNAAATAVVLGVPLLLMSDDANKLSAWTALIGRVCTAASAAGISTAVIESIRKKLVAKFPDLLKTMSATGHAVCSSAAVAGTFVAAWECTKALYYFLQSWMASMDNDAAASQMYCDKAKQLLTLDTLCRAAAASVTAAVITACTAAGMLPAAGPLSVIIDTIVYWIASSIMEHILERKNHYGGWLTWFRTFFQEDMRAKVWTGETFEAREQYITDELYCNILHTVVVDPVRYVRTGHLYERQVIYAWIDREGRDPIDRETLVTRLDYVASPLAKALAREVAEDILGATLASMA